MTDEEHSWRSFDLGGGVTLTIALSGNVLMSDEAGRELLSRLLSLLDEGTGEAAEAST